MPLERDVHLRDLFAIVVKRWKIVVLLAVAVPTGAFFAGRNASPLYQSSLTVQISSPKQVFARLDDIDVDELALKTDPVLSEALVLTTQSLALNVVRRRGLALELHDPNRRRLEWLGDVDVDSLAPPDSFALRRNADGFSVTASDGTSWGPFPYDREFVGPGFSFHVVRTSGVDEAWFSIVPAELAAARVTAGLSYAVRDGTNAVDVYYTGADSSLVPGILNGAALELREYGASRSLQHARRRTLYIDRQLRQANDSFQGALKQLQSYKERHEVTDLSAEQLALSQSVRNLDQDRQLASVSIATYDEVLATTGLSELELANRLAPLAGTADNEALAYQIQLVLRLFDERRTLTAGPLGLQDANPQVDALNQRIREAELNLRDAAKAALHSVRARRDALTEQIDDLRRQLLSYPGKEARVADLQLKASLLDDTYRYLLGQQEAARMQQATIAPYVEIMDGASPPRVVGTTLLQKIVLGGIVGLILGIGGAFFIEYLDQTIKTSNDVGRALGIPVLGLIPGGGQNGTRGEARHHVSTLDPDSPVAEAYRALRTNVMFVGAEKPLQFITVTSPGPGEGKSTTATNLAVTYAQQGSRTLLIDADLRRPFAHRVFNLPQNPGLTDALVGGVSLEQVIHRNVLPGLDILTAGSHPPNPAELLGSDAMQRTLEALRGQYQNIVADTPPTLAVTDAAVLGASADATMLVLRSGQTEEVAGQRALEQLKRVQARIAGAVLNDVSRRRDRYYSYYAYNRNGAPNFFDRMRGMLRVAS